MSDIHEIYEAQAQAAAVQVDSKVLEAAQRKAALPLCAKDTLTALVLMLQQEPRHQGNLDWSTFNALVPEKSHCMVGKARLGGDELFEQMCKLANVKYGFKLELKSGKSHPETFPWSGITWKVNK
jgi:hypothetical protein